MAIFFSCLVADWQRRVEQRAETDIVQNMDDTMRWDKKLKFCLKVKDHLNNDCLRRPEPTNIVGCSMCSSMLIVQGKSELTLKSIFK